MIQVCSGWNRNSIRDGSPCKCGLTYNDTERSREWPHKLLNPDWRMSWIPASLPDVVLECAHIASSWGTTQYIGKKGVKHTDRFQWCETCEKERKVVETVKEHNQRIINSVRDDARRRSKQPPEQLF